MRFWEENAKKAEKRCDARLKVAAEKLLEEITPKEIVAEGRKLMETFQLAQFEEDNQPIHENDEDVSETVVQVSSDEEDSDCDFIRVFVYNSDGEVKL